MEAFEKEYEYEKNIYVLLAIMFFFTSVFNAGVSVYAVEEENSPEVVSIEYTPAQPYEFFENACGWWLKDYKKNEYFHYYFLIYEDGDQFTVNYSDGKSITYTCSEDEYYDEEGNTIDTKYLSFDDNQHSKHWTIDSENYITVSYMGCEGRVPVTIVENPVESTEFIPAKPYEFVENQYGDWRTGSDYEDYFNYDYAIHEEGNQFIVNYKDGNSTTYICTEGRFYDEEGNIVLDLYQTGKDYNEYYEVKDNQKKEHWAVGRENYFTIFYMGYECKVPVTIVENPVESIEFTLAQPYELIENQYGYWRTDSAGNDYFYYYYSIYEKGNQLTVNFKDGKSVTYTYEDGFFDEEGNAIDKKYLDYDDNQREKNWTVDSENYFTVSYMGHECKVPVTIVENPVESIEFTPAQPYEFIENGYGYWITESAGNKYFRYDYYIYEKGNQLTVNYNDGKSITYTEDGFYDEEGNTIDKKYWNYDSIQYSKHWTIDRENYFTVSYMGHECKIPVTIVESQVMSITAKATSKILEYSSNAMPTITLTVNYKDGQSKTFENVNDLSLTDEMRVDINKISLGEYEVIYAGAKTNVTAEIVNDVYVTDIDIKQIKTIDNIRIYDVAFMDCLECTVTFSDGTVVKYNGTSIDPAINHTGTIVVLGQYNFKIYVDSITKHVKNHSKIKLTVGDYEKEFVVDNSVHYHTYSQEITVPTCEEKGYTTYKCTGCDYSYKDDYVNANGHNYGSEWSKDATNHWHVCACGEKKDVAAHTYDAGKITKAATETSGGIKTFTCTVCGATKTEKIPATGSSTPKVVTKFKDAAGKAIYKVTGADKSNLTVEYIALVNKKTKSVTIPATIKAKGITYKVTSIAGDAFKNNKKLTKVTIGKNVTTIGEKAFYKCTELTKIIIPSKVSKIGKQAFYGCKKLKSITVKTTKLNGKNVGKQAFRGINAKATIKVPKSKLKGYKKLLKSKGVGSKATIKK